MFRFMTVTTALLAAVFYQQSGGSDFEPWERDLPDYVRTQAPTPYTLATVQEADAPMAAQASTMPAVFTSHTANSAAPVRLASIGSTNDAGLDPALDGLPLTQVTRAAYTPGDDGITDSSTRRGVTQAAARDMVATPEERRAVVDGTRPASAPSATQDTATDTPTPSRDLRAVSGDRVNLRSGPGTGYGVLVTLDGGTPVEVIDESGGWLKLKMADGNRIGWMAERLVSASY